jgi:hypothetical protein
MAYKKSNGQRLMDKLYSIYDAHDHVPLQINLVIVDDVIKIHSSQRLTPYVQKGSSEEGGITPLDPGVPEYIG